MNIDYVKFDGTNIEELLQLLRKYGYEDAIYTEFTLHGNDELSLYKVNEVWFFRGTIVLKGCYAVGEVSPEYSTEDGDYFPEELDVRFISEKEFKNMFTNVNC